MSDNPQQTAGRLVEAARAAHPGSISWKGWRITYLGEVQLDRWLSGQAEGG